MDYVSPKIMYCCSNRQIEVFALNHVVDFWALSRCCVTSISLVTCAGKSSRVMAVGSDSRYDGRVVDHQQDLWVIWAGKINTPYACNRPFSIY
jgi:hypothetical protein